MPFKLPERVKQASPPKAVMEKVLRALDPRYSLKGVLLRIPESKELVQEYRTLLRTGGPSFLPGSRPLPLPTRLENYKFWKRTGDIPTISGPTKSPTVHTNPSEFSVHRPMRYEKTDEPIQLSSYGGDKGLQAALSSGRTKMDREYLIPGQTHSSRYGIYTYPSEVAERGLVYSQGKVGDPSRLDLVIPKREVLQSTLERPEVIIPEFNIRKRLSSQISKLGSPATLAGFFDELSSIKEAGLYDGSLKMLLHKKLMPIISEKTRQMEEEASQKWKNLGQPNPNAWIT